MKLRFAAGLAAIAFFSAPAHAMCTGSGGFYTCSDSSGNNYSVQRSGGMTNMQGHNSNTGSSWSQNSMDMGGGMTMHNGTAANGNSWSGTSQSLGGGMSIQSGTDSDGNYYSKTCTQYGCN